MNLEVVSNEKASNEEASKEKAPKDTTTAADAEERGSVEEKTSSVEAKRREFLRSLDGRDEGGGNNRPRKIRLDIPIALPRDGRNYTKCSPLSVTVSCGGTLRKQKCLMDPDSNTSIMDFNLFRQAFPTAVLDESIQITVHGVGQAATLG
jgi:hypothetical protein